MATEFIEGLLRLDDCPIHPRLAPFQCVNLLAKNARMRLVRQIQEYRQTYLESRLSTQRQRLVSSGRHS